MSLKPIAWLGSALDDLKAFPEDARQRAGFQLYRLQQGLEPTDWKPMPSVGIGVREIRIQTGRAFRILYVAKFAEAVYVLHSLREEVAADGGPGSRASATAARRAHASSSRALSSPSSLHQTS